MGIEYQDYRFIGLQAYIDRHQAALSGGALPYAHPVDGWIVNTLNSTPVKAILNQAIDAWISLDFGHLLSESITIDNRSFPELFALVSHCAEVLQIPAPHAVTHNGKDFFNAYTAGTDDYAFIYISPGLCQLFTEPEASFVIGHECGHIASGHMVYHTVANLLTGVAASYLGPFARLLRVTAGIPLMAWSRRSEITADRAGLLCCGDVEIAERALLRLVTGIADVERVDIEDYLARFLDFEAYHRLSLLNEAFATHPMIPRRIIALRLFAGSELYYSLSGKPRPVGRTLLSQDELDARVGRIVSP